MANCIHCGLPILFQRGSGWLHDHTHTSHVCPHGKVAEECCGLEDHPATPERQDLERLKARGIKYD